MAERVAGGGWLVAEVHGLGGHCFFPTPSQEPRFDVRMQIAQIPLRLVSSRLVSSSLLAFSCDSPSTAPSSARECHRTGPPSCYLVPAPSFNQRKRIVFQAESREWEGGGGGEGTNSRYNDKKPPFTRP